MKLGLINGSPRGASSNSDKILKWLTSDILDRVEIEKVYTIKTKEHDSSIAKIGQTDYIIFIFPLYTNAMPGAAKLFFEKMHEQKKLFEGKPILFIIHSGFPEAAHSRVVEKYCKNFARLMDMKYMGTIIQGGSESIQYAPENYFKKKIKAFSAVGEKILSNNPLSSEDVRMPNHKEHLSKVTLLAMKLFPFLSDIFWNSMLKKNNAFSKRYDSPYE